jgi:hypothetical protein
MLVKWSFSMRVVVAVVVLVTAPLWVARSADHFGVNANRPKGDEAKFLFDKVTETGVGWVRLDVVWEKIEHAPGVFDWSESDEPIREAASRGLKVFANLHASPGWATHEPKGCGMNTVDEKTQAKESVELLKLVETREWIQKIFFYELMDDPKFQVPCR